MLEIRRNLSYRGLEMFWNGPAILAIVLFSQASFYIDGPDTLASVHGGGSQNHHHGFLLTSAYRRDRLSALSAQQSDLYMKVAVAVAVAVAVVLRTVPSQSSEAPPCAQFL
jgi:hypothetical protein